ncbi:MAG: DUF2157 domain-containing protein [Pirellulales bacterium]
MSQQTRPVTEEQRRWLGGELAAWQSAGIVSGEQAAQVLALYETTAQAATRRLGLAVSALLGLAALLVGASVLLVVGYNWDKLARELKLGIVFGAIISVYAAAFFTRFRLGYRRASEALFLLGGLLYGAGIWLVAQVFHLDSHYPDGVWWWAVGVLPLALVLDSFVLHLLAAALLALWGGMEVINFSHLGARGPLAWVGLGWIFKNAAWSLPFLAGMGLAAGYRRRSQWLVGLWVAVLTWWFMLLGVAWQFEWQLVYYAGGAGALLMVLAAAHRQGDPLATPYRTLGLWLLGGALVPLSFASFHDWQPAFLVWGSDAMRAWIISTVLSFGLLATAISLAALLRPLRPGDKPYERLLAIARDQWFPVSMAVGLTLMALWDISAYGLSGANLAATAVANVAMVALAFWRMRFGLREDRGRDFSLGVAYFLLWLVLRYVDLFGQYGGMLGAALVFFLCGLALAGVAWFWGQRREVAHA